MARSTIGRGLEDLEALELDAGKVRRAGGGRLPLTQIAPTLLADLRAILEPSTLGDSMRSLLWVSKSHAKLAAALVALGHRVAASSPNCSNRRATAAGSTARALSEKIGCRARQERYGRE